MNPAVFIPYLLELTEAHQDGRIGQIVLADKVMELVRNECRLDDIFPDAHTETEYKELEAENEELKAALRRRT